MRHVGYSSAAFYKTGTRHPEFRAAAARARNAYRAQVAEEFHDSEAYARMLVDSIQRDEHLPASLRLRAALAILNRKGDHWLPMSIPALEDTLDTVDTMDNTDTVDSIDTIETIGSVDSVDIVDGKDDMDNADTLDTLDTGDTAYTADSIETMDTVDTVDTMDTADIQQAVGTRHQAAAGCYPEFSPAPRVLPVPAALHTVDTLDTPQAHVGQPCRIKPAA